MLFIPAWPMIRYCWKVADDTENVYLIAKYPGRQGKKIQNYLDRLEHRVQNNRMKFNRDKCKVLHLGKRNQTHSYKMGDT